MDGSLCYTKPGVYTTAAGKLVEELFCRFSPPERLHSDQERQIEGQVMQDICWILHIWKTRITLYNPQGGLVERFNCIG